MTQSSDAIVPLGAMRLNSDSQKLEYWMGSAWMQIQTFSPNLDGGVRGLFMGGSPNSAGKTIDFITIPTAGNATDFGDTTITNTSRMALSDSTRGIVAGGYASPAKSNVIEYMTIATLGNAQDFGDLTYGAYEPEGALSNSTRGVLALGDALVLSETNAIDYITIQTTGNAKDFGDLTQRIKEGAACSDSHGGIS